jgi:hypothetical protein
LHLCAFLGAVFCPLGGFTSWFAGRRPSRPRYLHSRSSFFSASLLPTVFELSAAVPLSLPPSESSVSTSSSCLFSPFSISPPSPSAGLLLDSLASSSAVEESSSSFLFALTTPTSTLSASASVSTGSAFFSSSIVSPSSSSTSAWAFDLKLPPSSSLSASDCSVSFLSPFLLPSSSSDSDELASSSSSLLLEMIQKHLHHHQHRTHLPPHFLL